MRSAFALRINNGRIIFVFGIAERLRAFRYPIFTREDVTVSGTPPRWFPAETSARRGALSVIAARCHLPRKGEVSLYLPADGEKLLLRGSWLRMQ